MESATPVWHDCYVTKEEAMQELKEAVEDLRAHDQRLRRFAAALYAADKEGIKQVDLVALTGYTREQIRRHVEDERIRRGEIPPTPRYLKNLERAEARKNRQP
jgi:hypothetical protein